MTERVRRHPRLPPHAPGNTPGPDGPETGSGLRPHCQTPPSPVGPQQASDVLAPVKSGRGSEKIMHTPHDLFLETPRPDLTSTARAAVE